MQPTGVIVVDEPGRQMSDPRRRTVPRSAGRRLGELRPGDRPGGRRGAAGRPGSPGSSVVSFDGLPRDDDARPRRPARRPDIDDDRSRRDLRRRAASSAGDVRHDRRVRGPAGLARSYSRDDQRRLAATCRRPARAGSATSTSCSRDPTRRRDARQRRLRDLGRPRRHAHPAGHLARPAGRASPRADPRADRPACRPHRHRSSTPASPTVRGSARSCHRSRSMVPSSRSAASPPTCDRSTDFATGPGGQALLHEILGGALQRVVSGATSSGKTSLLVGASSASRRPTSGSSSSRTPANWPSDDAQRRSGSRRGPRSPTARRR